MPGAPSPSRPSSRQPRPAIAHQPCSFGPQQITKTLSNTFGCTTSCDHSATTTLTIAGEGGRHRKTVQPVWRPPPARCVGRGVPLVSNLSCMQIFGRSISIATDTLAEWLRRRPAKPMGSPRVGSNPTGVASLHCEKRTTKNRIIDAKTPCRTCCPANACETKS